MGQALYRKYRSRSLDEIVGQDHITSLLRAAIAAEQISHAYLLTGPRGVGKTSIARIIAHEINNLEYSDEANHLDIIEIDAASNNGVEDVRDLREKVHIAPSSARKKVYIIDEVHMLSKQAFNALLKTLEEPPEHVVFILATTDVEKLPATIVSRVQRFNFRTVPEDALAAHLRFIAEKESIDITDNALRLIARHGRGSFRDSISLLDQLRSGASTTIDADTVRAALGTASDDVIEELVEAYRAGKLSEIIRHIDAIESTGAAPASITQQLITHLQSTIDTHPGDIATLERLLDVSQSSYPYIKLLAVLSSRANNDTPTDTRPSKPQKRELETKPTPPPTVPSAEPIAPKASEQSAPTNDTSSVPSDFSWTSLIDAANGDVGLKTILGKCGHAIEGDTLVIYAGSKFNAERLKSAKQQPKLSAALEKIGANHYSLDIRGEKTPPSDSQTASVAAIMGGGEEVAYDG